MKGQKTAYEHIKSKIRFLSINLKKIAIFVNVCTWYCMDRQMDFINGFFRKFLQKSTNFDIKTTFIALVQSILRSLIHHISSTLNSRRPLYFTITVLFLWICIQENISLSRISNKVSSSLSLNGIHKFLQTTQFSNYLIFISSLITSNIFNPLKVIESNPDETRHLGTDPKIR